MFIAAPFVAEGEGGCDIAAKSAVLGFASQCTRGRTDASAVWDATQTIAAGWARHDLCAKLRGAVVAHRACGARAVGARRRDHLVKGQG